MKNEPTKEQLEDLYYKKDLNIKQVAKELQRGHTQIWELFKKYGIRSKDRCKFKNTEEQINSLLGRFKNADAKNWVSKWTNERIVNGKDLKYILGRIYTFLKILDTLKKPIKQIIKNKDKETISKHLNSLALNGKIARKHKVQLKAFFKWVNDGEHPKCTKWIDLKKTLAETKPDIELLTDKERKLILDNAPSQRDRLIFSILNENPTRPRDICNLQIKDVTADEYGYEIKMHSKTKKGFRSVRLIHSCPDMRLYLSTHKFKNNPEAPLFYSISNRDKSDTPKPLEWNGLNYALQESCRRSGIKRKINLYHFRKTITTELLQDARYTPKEIQVMGGWSTIGVMMDTYGKVTDSQVNQKKLIVNGRIKDKKIEKENLFKPKICPRCEKENPSNVDTCMYCWLPLSKKAIIKLEETRNQIAKDIMEVDVHALQKILEIAKGLK